MPIVHKNQALTLLDDPSEEEIRLHLPAQAVPKVLRPLDPDTGNWERGAVQCLRILSVVYNPWTIEVFYATRRPDGSSGTQFMRFYPWTATMRCLAVTGDGRVVLLQGHRRQRGAWVEDMHPAGGVRKGGALEAAVEELFEEAGCKPTDQSTISTLGAWYMDDGLFADPLHLIVIDRLEAPESFANPAESIRGIRLVPWMRWYPDALAGQTADIYATIFAARCRYDWETERVLISGRHEILRAPH